MLKYILFLSLFGFNSMAATPVNGLVSFLNANKQKVLDLAKKKYEYTYYQFNFEQKNCVAKNSLIGPVGMCLVTALANEENAIAYFSVNVTSDYAGTGSTKRNFSITLIDYEI